MRRGFKIIIYLLPLIFVSCMPSPKIVPPGPNIIPSITFDYQSESPKKATEPFTFLLLSAETDLTSPYSTTSVTVAVKFENSDVPYFSPETNSNIRKVISRFSNAITEDIKELMTAKGYRLVQLVKTQDEATYAQREMSNFAIRPKVSVEIEDRITKVIDPIWKITKILPGSVEGILSVRAQISVEMKEPITWQLLWLKYVETEPLEEGYTFKWNWGTRNAKGYSGFQIGEDSRPQALAELLWELYNEVLKKIDIYFDPAEFAMVNKQAQEVRKKAIGVVK